MKKNVIFSIFASPDNTNFSLADYDLNYQSFSVYCSNDIKVFKTFCCNPHTFNLTILPETIFFPIPKEHGNIALQTTFSIHNKFHFIPKYLQNRVQVFLFGAQSRFSINSPSRLSQRTFRSAIYFLRKHNTFPFR